MEKPFREFNNLITDNRTALANSKEDMAIFFQSIEKETARVEKEFTKLKKENAEVQAKVDELIEKEKLLEPQLQDLEANIDAFTPQEIKKTCDAVFEVQVKLAAAQERKISLKKNCEEWEMRLIELYKKKENAEKLFSQIESLVGDASKLDKVAGAAEPAAEGSSFGLKIIHAQEEERRRVAREIHDGPAQAMANVIFLAEVCEKLIETDANRAKRELRELRNQVCGCLDETRKIIFDLRPMVLDDLGLIPTVKRIVDILKERMGIQTGVRLLGNHGRKLDSNIEVSLFRIIQEALNNIEKHSKASEVQVTMDFRDEQVTVVIKDNGTGFEIDKNGGNSESFGLLGMRERVGLLKGELKISSHRGAGTEITVTIPLASSHDEKLMAEETAPAPNRFSLA